ncbi:MAG: cupredoxin domain-containing protein [Gemmatimonas sp.]
MKRILIAAAVLLVSSSVAHSQEKVTLLEWKILMPRDTFPAGRRTFEVKNLGSMTHGFKLKGVGVDTAMRDLAKNETGNFSIVLKPGTYELYCPLAENSHKMAGMTKTLVVTAAPAKPPL